MVAGTAGARAGIPTIKRDADGQPKERAAIQDFCGRTSRMIRSGDPLGAEEFLREAKRRSDNFQAALAASSATTSSSSAATKDALAKPTTS